MGCLVTTGTAFLWAQSNSEVAGVGGIKAQPAAKGQPGTCERLRGGWVMGGGLPRGIRQGAGLGQSPVAQKLVLWDGRARLFPGGPQTPEFTDCEGPCDAP